jgi:hypothetical protein
MKLAVYFMTYDRCKHMKSIYSNGVLGFFVVGGNSQKGFLVMFKNFTTLAFHS